MDTGNCPVCGGSSRMPCPDDRRQYGILYGWNGYDKTTDTIDCNNCGGQYQWGKPSGKVRLDKKGEPCKHDYHISAGMWRCTTNYDCVHCGDHYMIDSGD